MAGKSDQFEADILNLVFLAQTIALIAQNNSSPTASLYFSLHIADPVEASTQDVSEVPTTNYAAYVRIGKTRDNNASTGFVAAVSGTSGVLLQTDVIFAAGNSASGPTVSFAGIGVASSGATKLLYSGQLSPAIAVTSGITPRIAASGTSVTEA